ncbi:hypothetical protein N7541_006439 [Penicillium brevicompactum]|uniref:Uncharacterized protein n=1 Tax=Penicillium brevicompactum TaxID=5074 RepID=A0A9W9USI2_PENBR|nr:hypothetical protein N7541_006439 [Penicillium brevicompactum]
MSYYEPQGWQAPAARQVSWEQPAPPSRSGSSSVSQREDIPAFSSQFDEVDRAIDNLVKSGKLWNAPRRDSMPMMMGRPYPDYDPQRPPSGNAQGFYASQRYQGRPNEVEQMMQAKRRMAAQRERELRNYHQEQQYNRSLLAEMSASKSDRSTSPAAVSEDSRRDLLARQHRALQAASTPGVRGSSPRAVDPFGLAGSTEAQTPSRANSTSSPSSAINAGFEQPVTSPSPATDSSRQPSGSVGPIGSRVQQTPPNPALNKRSITPLPSPLGLGFTPADPAPERTSSAGPVPVVPAPGPKDPAGVGLGWSNGSGVWGSKSGLGVQASVWG